MKAVKFFGLGVRGEGGGDTAQNPAEAGRLVDFGQLTSSHHAVPVQKPHPPKSRLRSIQCVLRC